MPTQFVCIVCSDETNDITDSDRPLPYTNIIGDAGTCGNLVETAERAKRKRNMILLFREKLDYYVAVLALKRLLSVRSVPIVNFRL